MSDDEQQAAETEAPVEQEAPAEQEASGEQEEAPSAPAPAAPAALEETKPASKGDEDEGRRRMEAAKIARAEKQAQEMAEYEEMRKEEREREQADIQALRERRAQRLKEREEEEKRTAELRAQEEARRKAEEEERRKKKAEEERIRNEEREKKRKAAEERLKPKKPNYVITKKADGSASQAPKEMSMGRDIYQKSKEQLEEEKRAILAQRIPVLTVEGLDSNRLTEKAKELHTLIRKLEGDKYDLEQQFKRQQYDMIELQERARQMNKGKKGVSSVQVDESFDRLADKHTGAPPNARRCLNDDIYGPDFNERSFADRKRRFEEPKIALCSKYERHTDHRTYVERKDLFEDLAKEPPEPEIQHVEVPWGAGQEQEAAAAE